MDSDRRIIAVVTGNRAEYGLLRPVISAIASHPGLELRLMVTGTHLLPPQRTLDQVMAEYPVHAVIPMQMPGQHGRLADGSALGRGVSGFAAQFVAEPPDVVVVLGDKLEAFAAAAAASIAGIRVAHLHGGDRAPGVADEAMRHAISKLAHIHLPATARSAERLIAMGEEPLRVHLVGSPAIDCLATMPTIDDDAYVQLGQPQLVFLLHGQNRDDEEERLDALMLLAICSRYGKVLAIHPNFDHGRDGIVRAIEESGVEARAHLPRSVFVGLLRRARALVGNSSTGLIECAALGTRCVNVGPRQAGCEKPPHVIDVPDWSPRRLDTAIARAVSSPPSPFRHPYGDGRAGPRTAEVLATFDLEVHSLTKKNSY
jgi:UDP-hydrolysing UDP-N-acetyl-D-glucosamine 2-epimerase